MLGKYIVCSMDHWGWGWKVDGWGCGWGWKVDDLVMGNLRGPPNPPPPKCYVFVPPKK